MPIEIKELHIKVTVPSADSRDTAPAQTDLFLFGAAASDRRGGTDADFAGATLPDERPADPGPVEAAPAVHHSGGVNMTWGDGSVRGVSDGFDLFG